MDTKLVLAAAAAAGLLYFFGSAPAVVTINSPREEIVYCDEDLEVSWEASGVRGDFTVLLCAGKEFEKIATAKHSERSVVCCLQSKSIGKTAHVEVHSKKYNGMEVVGLSRKFVVQGRNITLNLAKEQCISFGLPITVSWNALGLTGNLIVAIIDFDGNIVGNCFCSKCKNMVTFRCDNLIDKNKQYRIIVADIDRPTLFGLSTWLSVKVPSVRLSLPYHKVFYLGLSHTFSVSWTVENLYNVQIEDIGKMKITVQNKEGPQFSTIVLCSEKRAVFSNTRFTLAETYEVTVCGIDCSTLSGCSAFFTVQIPTITVYSPSEDVLYIKNNLEVTWVGEGLLGPPMVEILDSDHQQIFSLLCDPDQNSCTLERCNINSCFDGQLYYVLVRDSEQLFVQGSSPFFRIQEPTIKLTSHFEQVMYVNDILAVSWVAEFLLGAPVVDICSVETKGNSVSASVFSLLCKDNENSCNIDLSGISPGMTYVICVQDSENTEVFVISKCFEVKERTITVTSPVKGFLYAGHPLQVSWNAVGVSNNVEIVIYRKSKKIFRCSCPSQPCTKVFNPATFLVVGKHYKVSLFDSKKPRVTGSSVQFSVKAPMINVVRPDQDVFFIGHPIPVSWIAEGLLGKPVLQVFDLAAKKDVFTLTCSASETSTSLKAASYLKNGKKYVITISDSCSMDVNGTSTGFFVKSPSINVVFPLGEVLFIGHPITVSWISEGILGELLIQVFSSDRKEHLFLQTSPSSVSSATFKNVPCLQNGGKYKITVSDSQCPSLSETSQWFIAKEPTVVVTSPSNKTLFVGGKMDVVWEAEGFRGNPSIAIFRGNRQIYSKTMADASVSAVLKLPKPSETKYRVVVSDSFCNAVCGSSQWFSIKVPKIRFSGPKTCGDGGRVCTVSWDAGVFTSQPKISLYKENKLVQENWYTTQFLEEEVFLNVSRCVTSGKYSVCVIDAQDETLAYFSEKLFLPAEAKHHNLTTSSTDQVNNECVICLDQFKDILLLPCKHVCVCSDCFGKQSVKDCPICRNPVEEGMKIFL